MSAIQKYQDPFFDLMPTRFSALLDRFFDDSVATRGQWTSFTPKVDTYETDQGYDIEAQLPGLRPDDVKVSFADGRLTIAGERKFENEQNGRHYHVVESAYGSFVRSFQLPQAAEPGKIDAAFDNGILHVHVPKNGQQKAQQQIPIRTPHNGK